MDKYFHFHPYNVLHFFLDNLVQEATPYVQWLSRYSLKAQCVLCIHMHVIHCSVYHLYHTNDAENF